MENKYKEQLERKEKILKEKQKKKQRRLKEIEERLKKPLFKQRSRTMTKGGKLKVSAEKGIRGLLGTI